MNIESNLLAQEQEEDGFSYTFDTSLEYSEDNSSDSEDLYNDSNEGIPNKVKNIRFWRKGTLWVHDLTIC